jgi:hypothetical protein
LAQPLAAKAARAKIDALYFILSPLDSARARKQFAD